MGLIKAANRWRIGLDRQIGRRLFAVDTPLSRGIRSSRHQRKMQAASALPATESVAFNLSDLSRDGCLALPAGYYDAALVSDINSQISAAMADNELIEPRGQADPNGIYYAHAICDVSASAPAVAKIFTDELRQFIEAHFQSYISIPNLRVYRTSAVPAEFENKQEFFSDGWHWDQRYTTMIKLFYLVHDTGPQDGPFHYFTAPDSGEVLRAGYQDRHHYAGARPILENPSRYRSFTGSAGDALLCNTARCAHRAGHPAPGHTRDMVMIHILPSETPLPDNWFEQAARQQSLKTAYK